jgi:hypothetical protein
VCVESVWGGGGLEVVVVCERLTTRLCDGLLLQCLAPRCWSCMSSGCGSCTLGHGTEAF